MKKVAYIKVEEIQQHTDKLKDWLTVGESPAKECLVIKFKSGTDNIVIDEEMVNQTLYLQSRNGNVSIQFDASGQIVSIEIV